MWVTENEKTGKFIFNDIYKNPITNKWKHVSVTYGKNTATVRKNAQLELNKKIQENLSELKSGDTDITLEELSHSYLKLAKHQLAESTYYRKEHTLTKIIDVLDENSIAKRITSTQLNKYFDNLLYSENLANATVQAYKATLSTIYEHGIRYGYLTKNPVKNAKPTYKNERAKKNDEIENKYLTDSELQKIFKDCDKQKRPDLKDLFNWMYLTGMRIGEAASLQKKNILQNKDGEWFARVNGTLLTHRNESNKAKRHTKGKSAKTWNGNRDILLSDEAIKLVKEHCKNKNLNDYIFTNKWKTSDGYFIASKVDRVLKSIAKRQGIKKHLTTHFFRHTHVSKLAELGIPLYVIQRRVGHGNSRITRDIYLHITDKTKESLKTKLQMLSDVSTNQQSLKILKN